MKSICAIYDSYGVPAEVVKPVSKDVEAPKFGQVLIKLERASINPSDLGMIGGSYGRLRTLPAIGGREGVGTVAALGGGVENLKVGDRVRIPEEPGVWRQYQTAEAAGLIKVPSDIPADMACQSFVNPPTALLVLDSFKDLKPGDWVIQNGASSALGRFMIQICASRGIKTVNMVRRADERRAELEAIGADIVVDEASYDAKQIKAQTGKGPILGLNQIGGESVSNMIKTMGDGATVITIGGMTGQPIKFPTRFLIFNGLTLCGFWWDKWQRTHTPEEVDAVYAEVFSLVQKGVLKAPVDSVFALDKVSEALARASQNSRFGKVLLSFD